MLQKTQALLSQSITRVFHLVANQQVNADIPL